MKHLYLSVLLIMGFTLQAQVEERIVSMQPNYENQVFFDIETGSTTSIQMGSWDIAFDLTPSGVGIVYNEGGTREGTTIELAAYLAPTNDFTTVFSNPTEEERIYNNEESWSDGGAFNVVADPESAGDIGWGIYDESTQSATGTRVFIIGMRDGSFRKIEFSGYSNGVFTGRHANLDGTDEVNFSVDKANFSGKRLAYYNMTTNEVLDLEPAEWDLKFTRYFQLATQFGQTREYPFTGILH
ncbi:MAG: HmuY family protein, partial [Bacteroidota bacterium]